MFLPFEVIHRCIQLLACREQTGSSCYRDMVRPLMEEVWRLHFGYVMAFRRYQENLIVTGQIDDSFLEDIAGDMWFSADLKACLRTLADTKSKVEPCLASLIREIQSYLELAAVNPLQQWMNSVDFVPGKVYSPSVAMGAFDSYILPDFYILDDDQLDELMLLELKQSHQLTIDRDGHTHLVTDIDRLLRMGGLSPKVATRLAIRLIECVVTELQRKYSVIVEAHRMTRAALLG